MTLVIFSIGYLRLSAIWKSSWLSIQRLGILPIPDSVHTVGSLWQLLQAGTLVAHLQTL